MKTPEQILERFLSPESKDLYNVQKMQLLCSLPYHMAKEYIETSYTEAQENGTLPSDETWCDDVDVTDLIKAFFPDMYKRLYKGDQEGLVQSFLTLKTWLWILEHESYDEVATFCERYDIDKMEDCLRKVSNQFGYKHFIENVEFEEIKENE
jgi:hypothetical protein